MASSRKPPSGNRGVVAAAERLLSSVDLRRKRLVAGLSGGVDSVVLLHVLKALAPAHGFSLRALHVHHGISPNADAWARFCRSLCRAQGIPLQVEKVRVAKSRKGLEAAAREARYEVLAASAADAVALAHNLDDQAETVLFNLLRGAGVRGASGMPAKARLGDKGLLRPLLDVPRSAILAYARAHGLEWVEDESNADDALTRNFLRRRVGPLLEPRFPRWKESLARAARHFARREAGAQELMRAFLRERGLKAPSEAKLAEMLKQLTAAGGRTAIEHEGVVLRSYRGTVSVEKRRRTLRFEPLAWRGERRMPIPALGGEVRFRRARGKGFAVDSLRENPLELRARTGGERLQPDARRPRRTLKNLFQEAGVPAWERERLPLLYRGRELVWVPGLGIDARFQAPPGAFGWVPEWRV